MKVLSCAPFAGTTAKSAVAGQRTNISLVTSQGSSNALLGRSRSYHGSVCMYEHLKQLCAAGKVLSCAPFAGSAAHSLPLNLVQGSCNSRSPSRHRQRPANKHGLLYSRCQCLATNLAAAAVPGPSHIMCYHSRCNAPSCHRGLPCVAANCSTYRP